MAEIGVFNVKNVPPLQCIGKTWLVNKQMYLFDLLYEKKIIKKASTVGRQVFPDFPSFFFPFLCGINIFLPYFTNSRWEKLVIKYRKFYPTNPEPNAWSTWWNLNYVILIFFCGKDNCPTSFDPGFWIIYFEYRLKFYEAH